MKNFRKIVVGVLLASILLQPLGLITPVLAETVEMRYDNTHPLHAPEVVDGAAYEYDANGNLVDDGERRIEWNQDNMPVRIEKDGKVVEFFYDANGRRIVKRSDQGTQTYVDVRYQSFTDAQNNTSTTKYYFANGKRVAARHASPSSGQGQALQLHYDHLGSTVLATDSNSQKLTEPLLYFPYGSSTSNQQLTISNYLFTGQELDPESDLYNYNARLYNPTTGSFISADSVGSGNRYAYAANNPIMFTDPTGHMLDAGGGGGGGRPYLPLITKDYDGYGGPWISAVPEDASYEVIPESLFKYFEGPHAWTLPGTIDEAYDRYRPLGQKYPDLSFAWYVRTWDFAARGAAMSSSLKVVNTTYVSNGGQVLHVNPEKDAGLRRLIKRGADYIKKHRTSRSISRAKLVAEHVAKDIPYSAATQQATYAQGVRGEAWLGQFGGGALCREKAIIAHGILAEGGKQSWFVAGNINGGRHAWVEYIDTISGQWTVMDPTQNIILERSLYYAQKGVSGATKVLQFFKPGN